MSPTVRWGDNESFSDFGSPISHTSSSGSQISTGSLDYINAQLQSHGFLYDGGLSLDGLSDKELDKVVKCMLKLLGQRIEDMDRAEQLSTKFRTLSYDYERLSARQRDAVERAANAEREMNLHKSKLGTATRTLQTTTNAHKTTTAELQRTRSTLNSLRSTHQAELRKRDKETERMVERWAKLSDSQLRAGSLSSGISFAGSHCANSEVRDGSEVLGKRKSYVEDALDDSERAREELANENARLRRTLVRVINEAQSILYQLRLTTEDKFNEEEPSLVTLSDLFPLSPEDVVATKFSSLFSSFNACIMTLSDPNRPPPQMIALNSSTPGDEDAQRQAQEDAEKERKRLEATVNKLKIELDQSRKEVVEQEEQTRILLDKFAKLVEQQHIVAKDPPEPSVELMSQPLQDEAQKRLDEATTELAEERTRFTEATVKLGRERAELEKERAKLLEERRQWEVERMLKELPPTPVVAEPKPPAPKPTATAPASRDVQPRRSPRRPAVKSGIGRSPPKPTATILKKSGHSTTAKATLRASKKGKPSRRTSLLAGLGGFNLSPSKPGVAAPFETEYIAPQATSPATSLPPITFPEAKIAIAPSSPLVTSEFVLPPPSPRAEFTPEPALFASATSAPKGSSSSTTPPAPSSTSAPAPKPTSAPAAEPAPVAPPKTPGALRPFPLAKPHARNMMHAYSPAKPSPLSRILSIADSPPSPGPDFTPMSRLDEVEINDISLPDASPTPASKSVVPPMRTASLEEELGLVDEESPLREKRTERVRTRSTTAAAKPRSKPEPRRQAVQEKDKGHPPSERTGTQSGAGGKANDLKKTGRSNGKVNASTTKGIATTNNKTQSVPPLKVATKASGATTKKPVVAPRRVPMDPAGGRKPFA